MQAPRNAQAGDNQCFLIEKSEITDFQLRADCRLCAPHTKRGKEKCSINNFSCIGIHTHIYIYRRSAKMLEKLFSSFQLSKTNTFFQEFLVGCIFGFL